MEKSKNYTLNATDYGLKYAPNSDFKGGSPEENLSNHTEYFKW